MPYAATLPRWNSRRRRRRQPESRAVHGAVCCRPKDERAGRDRDRSRRCGLLHRAMPAFSLCATRGNKALHTSTRTREMDVFHRES